MSKSESSILIVKSPFHSTTSIEKSLVEAGFEITLVEDHEDLLSQAVAKPPDIIFIPVELAEGDGIEMCYEIKNHQELSSVFVVLISKKKEDFTQIAGLDSGADDFLVSPVQARILALKLKALLRRKGNEIGLHNERDELRTEDFVIDRERYVVIQNDREIYLPKKEFELLSLLSAKPQKIFTRQEITHSVWGMGAIVQGRTIDVHIRKIREKIGKRYIQTIKGVGYRLHA